MEMQKTSETTENVENNGKHRNWTWCKHYNGKGRKTSEHIGKQQKTSETSELELVEIWYMTRPVHIEFEVPMTQWSTPGGMMLKNIVN